MLPSKLIGGIEMMNAKVSGVRSIELGVRDLQQSADFYTKVWALEEVGSEGDAVHFRGTGSEHHLLTIRQRPKPALLGVNFAAADRAWVDQLCAKAKRMASKCQATRRRCRDVGRRLRLPLREPRGSADEHLVGPRAASRRRP